MNVSSNHAKTESPWLERLRSLRNVPPVLRILWDSGATVVTWGLILRVFVAVLPFAVAKVAQYIIFDIADVLRGRPLASGFWTLVVAEVGLNVLLGLLMRAIDYFDSLLANRYTQYVSVRVMEQAARLDLTTYEDPIFYDRLERARVQATDRRLECYRPFLGRRTTRFWAMRRTSGRHRPSGKWTICGRWLGAAKAPRR